MTTNLIAGKKHSRFNRLDKVNQTVALHKGVSATPTSYPGSPLLTVPTGHVAVVDDVVCRRMANPTALTGGLTATLLTDIRTVYEGVTSTMTFASYETAATSVEQHNKWFPRGRMVFGPGTTIDTRATAAAATVGATHVGLTYYLKPVTQAISDGDWNGFHFAAGGSPATRTEIVPLKAGYHPVVEGIYVTGNNLSTTNTTVTLEFSDSGLTTNHKFFRADTSTVAGTRDPLIDYPIHDCHIVGPEGYKITATVAGGSGNGKVYVNVFGHYEKNADVWDPTGQAANTATIQGGQDFWFFTETTAAAPTYAALFPSGIKHHAILEGWAASHVSTGQIVTLGLSASQTNFAGPNGPNDLLRPCWNPPIGIHGATSEEQLRAPVDLAAGENLNIWRSAVGGTSGANGVLVWGKVRSGKLGSKLSSRRRLFLA